MNAGRACFPVVSEMSLWAAAVLAYKEVFSTRARGDRLPSNDELDLVALVLSGYLPIYGTREAGSGRSRLRDSELAQGMFWGGARRFEQRSNPVPVTGLVVRSPELEQALERIRGDVWPES